MLDGRLPAKAHQQTGIISFQVHQVAELFCSSGSQRRVRETKEEEALPSSYVNVFLDDEQIYRTRLKPLTSGAQRQWSLADDPGFTNSLIPFFMHQSSLLQRWLRGGVS